MTAPRNTIGPLVDALNLRAQPWPDAAADFMTRARRWLPAFNRALRQPALNKATPGN
jgi:hypothetical protein